MAAREDEAKPVVRDARLVIHQAVSRLRGREFCLDRDLATEQLGLVAQASVPAQPIECAIASGRRDPCRGVPWDAADRPRVERTDEGILNSLLGEVEIAQDADERRDGPALLLAKQPIDDLVSGRPGRRRLRRGQPAKSKIGRTSTQPCLAPGIIAA
jgi:hypothetical protein